MTARPNIPAVAAAPLAARIERQWDADIVPQLVDYIRIPAKSPHFDAQWAENGHIERAIRQAEAWVRAQPVAGMAGGSGCNAGRPPGRFFYTPPARGGFGPPPPCQGRRLQAPPQGPRRGHEQPRHARTDGAG